MLSEVYYFKVIWIDWLMWFDKNELIWFDINELMWFNKHELMWSNMIKWFKYNEK